MIAARHGTIQGTKMGLIPEILVGKMMKAEMMPVASKLNLALRLEGCLVTICLLVVVSLVILPAIVLSLARPLELVSTVVKKGKSCFAWDKE